MATEKQRGAARKNVRKARDTWQHMSRRERAAAQPEGRARRKPGRGEEGDFYHIGVRDKNDFESFRTHDVGDTGGIERVSGKRANGSWDTVKWLVSKRFAHVNNGWLTPDHEDARALFEELGTRPRRVEGDLFRARPRPNVPEKDKPTPAQKRARRENISKAQRARQGRHN